MTKYFQKIINWFKGLFGMTNTTKQREQILKSKAERIILAVKEWLSDLDKASRVTNSSDYSKIKNLEYYYQSVDKDEPDIANGIFTFRIANLSFEISQSINPISNTVTFITSVLNKDRNAETGIRYDEIESARIVYKVTDDEDVRKINGIKMAHSDLMIYYFDAIIDHFKDKDNEQGQKAA